jgi:hypothetical protein
MERLMDQSVNKNCSAFCCCIIVNYHKIYKYTTSLLGELASFQVIPMFLVQSDSNTTYRSLTYYVSCTEYGLFTDFAIGRSIYLCSCIINGKTVVLPLGKGGALGMLPLIFFFFLIRSQILIGILGGVIRK